MKKFLTSLCVAVASMIFVAAAEEQTIYIIQETEKPVRQLLQPNPPWKAYPVVYFQPGIWAGFPSSMDESQVYGIKSGWPICSGYGIVEGVEVSWLGSATDYIYGIQGSWLYCDNRECMGLQAALGVCNNRNYLDGVQASLVYKQAGDVRGLQAGLVNVAGDFIGFQPAAVLNVADELKGVQASVLLNVANYFEGLQASLINVDSSLQGGKGMQLGLINIGGGGIQFGLLNIMDDGILPCCPIVNFKL